MLGLLLACSGREIDQLAVVPMAWSVPPLAPSVPVQPAPPACLAGYRCDLDAHEPVVTEVRIEKSAHRLHLIADDAVVRSYGVAIGRGGAGPKRMEGDARTPVGRYRITSRLPKSPWHLFLGVSYPNVDDWARHRKAKRDGAVPWDRDIGFGIGIHGRRRDMADGQHKRSDWTLGCIALDNHEIEEVARLVPNGTAVVIEE
jgi:murein L,D-transpeptidase YafK